MALLTWLLLVPNVDTPTYTSLQRPRRSLQLRLLMTVETRAEELEHRYRSAAGTMTEMSAEIEALREECAKVR